MSDSTMSTLEKSNVSDRREKLRRQQAENQRNAVLTATGERCAIIGAILQALEQTPTATLREYLRVVPKHATLPEAPHRGRILHYVPGQRHEPHA